MSFKRIVALGGVKTCNVRCRGIAVHAVQKQRELHFAGVGPEKTSGFAGVFQDRQAVSSPRMDYFTTFWSSLERRDV